MGGVDAAWKQKKLEARKMFARSVVQTLSIQCIIPVIVRDALLSVRIFDILWLRSGSANFNYLAIF